MTGHAESGITRIGAESRRTNATAGRFVLEANGGGKAVADNDKAAAAWADYERKSNREWMAYQNEMQAARRRFDAACRAAGDKHVEATAPLWAELTAKLAAFDREAQTDGLAARRAA